MQSRDTCNSTASFESCRSYQRGTMNSININNNNNNNNNISANKTTVELLQFLTHAEQRVLAAWSRIGLSPIDCENKWEEFISRRLRPFLLDYIKLQEAEEMGIAAENDQLFREVFFASRRLKEMPKSREIAQLVEAVMESHNININNNSNNINKNIAEEEEEQFQGKQEEELREKSHASIEVGGVYNSSWDVEINESIRSRSASIINIKTQQTQILNFEENSGECEGSIILPSLLSVVSALVIRSDEEECGRSRSVSTTTTTTTTTTNNNNNNNNNKYQQQKDKIEMEQFNSRSPSLILIENSEKQDIAHAAIWKLAKSMTHQELHRNLTSEIQRMNEIADTRLQQLCLLYKQRALLQLPPQEQTILRSKYAEKFLSDNLYKLQQQQQQNELKSQKFGSLASVMSSTLCGAASATPGPSSARTTTTTTTNNNIFINNSNNNNNNNNRQSEVKEDELDLLSDSIPERLRINSNNEIIIETEEQHEEFSNHRGTIFEVDLSDIMRFGRRQDLSLARIDAETQEIYAAIITQNSHMCIQAEEELQCVEELWILLENGNISQISTMISEEKEKEDIMNTHFLKFGSNIPSRHEFITRLTQLQHEYEEPLSITGGNNNNNITISDETFSQVTGAGIVGVNNNNNNNNNNNTGVSSQRVTCNSRSHGCSLPRAHTFDTFSNINCNKNTILSSSSSSQLLLTSSLPAPLIKLFTAKSYAPILAYIVSIREQLQRIVLQRHVEIAQTITQELTEIYQIYFNKTRDGAYRVAPDYSRWLQENASAAAAEEEEDENNNNNNSKSYSNIYLSSEKKLNEELGIWKQFLTKFKPRNNNNHLRERIAEVEQVVFRAREELILIRQRLHILNEVEPLLLRRAEIYEQQRSIQEGSRERLLSKKVNMAKQLLFEENARRQFSRELPKLHEQLDQYLNQWNETVAGDNNNNNNKSNIRRLIVHGEDIAEIIRQYREDAAHSTHTRRPISSIGKTHNNNNNKSKSKSNSPTPFPPASAMLSSSSPAPKLNINNNNNNINFATPQRPPLSGRSVSHHYSSISPLPRGPQGGITMKTNTNTRFNTSMKTNNNNNNNTPMRVTTPPPQPSRLRAAKKSFSPTPLKTQRNLNLQNSQKKGLSPVPAVNEYIKQHPQSVLVKRSVSTTKKTTPPSHSGNLNNIGKK